MVPNALRACGVNVELKTDHFPQDTADIDWLPEVGRKGWVILSKDKNLRHNHIELVALLRSGAASFILTSGNFTGEEMAEAFVQALPQIRRILNKLQPPFVATVSKLGGVRVLYTFEGLITKVDIVARPSKKK